MVRLTCLPGVASILTSRSTVHLSIRPLITSFKRAGVVCIRFAISHWRSRCRARFALFLIRPARSLLKRSFSGRYGTKKGQSLLNPPAGVFPRC